MNHFSLHSRQDVYDQMKALVRMISFNSAGPTSALDVI
jgi:hypothetical protein